MSAPDEGEAAAVRAIVAAALRREALARSGDPAPLEEEEVVLPLARLLAAVRHYRALAPEAVAALLGEREEP